MKEAHEFLRDKGKAPGPINDFKKLLYKLWFKLYRRTKGDRWGLTWKRLFSSPSPSPGNLSRQATVTATLMFLTCLLSNIRAYSGSDIATQRSSISLLLEMHCCIDGAYIDIIIVNVNF